MAQRFGQAADYSQSFAFLWSQQDRTLQLRAEQLTERTEADQRARDELMFTKYNEGKIGGAAILSYIQKRIRQSGHSKAEQRKWKEALVEYRNNVVDNRATTAYNTSGNIHAYIAHWQKRLAASGRGTPERAEISGMLRQLIDQRDATALQDETRRLEREIQSGNKSTKDLIDLYKSKLAGASPALKAQIRDALAGLRKRLKQEQFATAYRKTMDAYKAGRISPQEAADQLGTSLDRYDIKTINPDQFNQITSQATELNGTPDPVVVARLEEQLDLAEISPEEYKNAMFELARQVGPYNQEAAINIRTHARKTSEQYELDNPSAIGQGGGTGQTAQETLQGAGAVRFISQLDGSKWSLENCTYASAAMLAAIMDKDNKFTGADLRAASRDYSGGGTILDAQNALMRKGVDGTRVRYDNRVDFDKFKNMVKQGAPASLSGYLGAMREGSIHNAGLRGGHNIVVVKYHPKKGFLVLDPARSSKEQGKFWMKEEDLKTFGWSARPGSFYRYGQAMFAPKGTIPTRWNKGKDYSGSPGNRGVNKRDGRKVSGPQGGGGAGDAAQTAGAAGVSADGDDVPNNAGIQNDDKPPVEQTPFDPDTPPEYADINAPGPSEVALEIERRTMIAMDPELEEILSGGITPGDPDLATPRMVNLEINNRNLDVSADFEALISFRERWSGDPEETVTVETEAGPVVMSYEDAQELQLDILGNAQGLVLLNDAVGNEEGATQATSIMRGAVQMGQELATTEYETNRDLLFRSTSGEIIKAVAKGDTEAALQAAIDGLDELVELGDNYTDEEATYDPTTGTVHTAEEQAQDAADTNNTGNVTDVEQGAYDATKLPSNVPIAEEGKTTTQEDVMGLAQLRDTLVGAVENGEPIPWETLTQVVNGFAAGAGIDMPDGWEEGDIPADHTDAAGTGLAILAQNTHDHSLVTGGVADWVSINGQIFAVEQDQDSLTYDANGQPVVEGVQGEEQTLDSGSTAQATFDAGPMVKFDAKSLNEALQEAAGYDESFSYSPSFENPENLVPVPRMVNGELTHEWHVPRLEQYMNVKFARITNAKAFIEMVKRQTGVDIELKDGQVLDQNTISQITTARNGGRVLANAKDGGILEDVPFEANVLRIDGRESWQDPVSEAWHDIALPWDGGGGILVGQETGAVTGYVGGKVDAGEGSMGTELIVPDITWGGNEEAKAGKPYPTYENVSDDDAEDWYQQGVADGWLKPVTTARDENNELYQMDPEEANSMYSTSKVEEAQRLAKEVEKQKEAADARLERARQATQERTEQTVENIGQAFDDTADDPMGVFAAANLNDQLNEVLKGNQTNPYAPPKPVPEPPSIEQGIETLDYLKKVEAPMPATTAPGDNPANIPGMTFNPEQGYIKVDTGFDIPTPSTPQKTAPIPQPGGGVAQKK